MLGEITGMTRYACFWVEKGEIVAPIENLRFDDYLYRFLGEGLIDQPNNKRSFLLWVPMVNALWVECGCLVC